MEIIARASSCHATKEYGPLRCVGHFRSAINFLTHGEKLLTLHRSGRGLSPMGWEIESDDFDEVSDELVQGASCQLIPEGIVMGDICILQPEHCADLSLRNGGEIAAEPLSDVLSERAAETGLAGRLDHLVRHPPAGEMAQIQRQFDAWLRGGTVDWSGVLGKGPGLTPSNDDTVLGMLFCAWFDTRIDVVQLPAFFAGSRSLEALTTLVSCHYLHFAAQGRFATPLHQLAAALSGEGRLTDAIRNVLETGHTSGADTLLGIWCGTRVINNLYSISR